MKKNHRVKLAIIAAFLSLTSAAQAGNDPKILIKMATLASKNSSMAAIFEQVDQDVRKRTGNTIGFRNYYGGVQGDEKEVLQKIKFKQLHGGAFTTAGLWQIVPEIHVLSLPYLFRNRQEVEYVRKSVKDKLEQLFLAKGYVVLAWGDAGFVYRFSKVPITSMEVAKKQRFWLWGNDPVLNAMYQAMGVTPVSLSITEVMTSLSANLIDAGNATPTIAVSLRWYTKFKYMSEEPFGCVQGASIVRKDIWDKVPPEHQKYILTMSQKYYDDFVKGSEKDDAKATGLLKKSGIQIMRDSDSTGGEAFREKIAKNVREALVGKLYSRELLDIVLKSLEEYRKKHPDSSVVKLK